MNTALGAIMAAKGLQRGCGGLWGYLASRVHGRTAVELERERNAATAAVIPLLPPGSELLETEPGGRTRMIRMAPVAHLLVIVRVDRRPSGELPQ